MVIGDGLDAETREPADVEARAAGARRVALTILHHADMDRAGERALPGGRIELSRLSPAFQRRRGGPQRPLEDGFLSRSPVRITVERGAVRFEQPERPTPLEVDGRPVATELVLPAEVLDRGVVIELGRRAVLLLHHLPERDEIENDDLGLIGDSAAMQRVRRDLRTFAPLSVPVLLRGATGTGKELAAAAIHRAGARAGGPFVAVNLAAIAPTVAASELFGHKKGAFTGAVDDHVGFFQRAHGGTLFLDEIGEASIELQVMLLRALETSTIQPVGGREVAVDVRLVSATDADLAAATRSGTFRPALLHRLQGYEIELPRLAERRADLGGLLVHFVKREAAELGVTLAPPRDDELWMPSTLASRLALHTWPGNVRELRNVARQIAVSIGQGETRFDRIRLAPEVAAGPQRAEAPAAEAPRARKPADVDDREILEVLERVDYRLERAAAELGISRTSLYRRVEKHPELRKSKDLAREDLERALAEAGGDLDRVSRTLKVSKAGLRLRMRELSLTPR